jgi:hypothetical protein
MDKKTIKDILDEACANAWTALMKTLSDNGIEFDDCDAGVYVDDSEEKKTYCLDISMNECDEYGGE